MISLELVRQEVMAVFQAVHIAHYSTTLVNYPDYSVVDFEHQKDPFVSVELDLTGVTRSALGERDLLVPATLIVYFHYREGRGMSGTLNYTDMLNTYLGMGQVGALQFEEVRPTSVKFITGWNSTMNMLPFNVVKELVC